MDNQFLYQPKYTITDEILTLVALIAARVDVLTIQGGMGQKRFRLQSLWSCLH